MHSSFVEMEMGSKGSSLRTVWRKANRPNSRKTNFGVHHKTLRMLDKNYLSSKTSLRTLAWSIDKEGVHGSFANCTGYLQSNCVYSRRLPKGSRFFQLKKVQLQSPGNVLPLRALHKLKTFLGGQTIHSIYTLPIYTRHWAILWSFQVGNWASGPLWTTWRRRRCRSGWCRGTFPGPTKSPQIRTSYDVYICLYDTYVSYKSCVYTIIVFISILYLCYSYTCILLCMFSIYIYSIFILRVIMIWYIMGYNMTQLGPDRSSDGLPLIKQPRGCPAGRPGAGCWERSTFQMFFKWLLRWFIFSFFLTSGSLGSLDVDLMKKKCKSL